MVSAVFGGSEATYAERVGMQKDLLPLKDVISLIFLSGTKEWPT